MIRVDRTGKLERTIRWNQQRGPGENSSERHLYMQTNEVRNAIAHYRRDADGTIELIERVETGGAGSGVFKPVSGQESAPNAFEGASSVILAERETLLFTTNGGDNSVTSFFVAPNGRLTVIDRQSTGEPVTGRSGTAKSLAYSPKMSYAIRTPCLRPQSPTFLYRG